MVDFPGGSDAPHDQPTKTWRTTMLHRLVRKKSDPNAPAVVQQMWESDYGDQEWREIETQWID